jgi:hypothetical protein
MRDRNICQYTFLCYIILAMTEFRELDTRKLIPTAMDNEYTEEGKKRLVGERVYFNENCWAEVRIAIERGTERLSSSDVYIVDLNNRLAIHYNYGNWPRPFPRQVGADKHSEALKAALHFQTARRDLKGRVNSGPSSGTIWYDEWGDASVISAENNFYHGTDQDLKFKKMRGGNWFWAKGIQQRPLNPALQGRVFPVENSIIGNGQVIEIGTTTLSITEEGDRLTLQQAGIDDPREKSIEVPSRIDISNWTMLLGSLQGWESILKQYPCRYRETPEALDFALKGTFQLQDLDQAVTLQGLYSEA